MAKWIVDTYETAKALETAIELLDNTVTIHVIAYQVRGGSWFFKLIHAT